LRLKAQDELLLKKKFDLLSLEETVIEREPEIVVNTIKELKDQFDARVSSEGIFNLHTKVETMNLSYSDKMRNLENMIYDLTLRDDHYRECVNQNEVLTRQNAYLEQRCKNLEYRILSVEKLMGDLAAEK
jgi:hypothetical protein